MIVYKLLPDGGFVAGDTDTRVTSYAYPSSIHATAARKTPKRVAGEMIAGEAWRIGLKIHTDYDARQWARLEA